MVAKVCLRLQFQKVSRIRDKQLKELTIEEIRFLDDLTSIGHAAFAGCKSLTNITIPDTVTEIGARAFDSCTGLTSITIPDSVTLIRSCAFLNCQECFGGVLLK